MKNCAVVPHIVRRRRQVHLSNVRHQPTEPLRRLAQSFSVRIDRGLRNVEDRDVRIAPREQVVYQGGLTTADVDDRRGGAGSRLCDERQRGLQVGTVPTDLVRRLLAVDSFPMGLYIHIKEGSWLLDLPFMVTRPGPLL